MPRIGGRERVAALAVLLTPACNNAPLEPPTPRYYVGGFVSGLAGTGLVLKNNGGDSLRVRADGQFTFSKPLAAGSQYVVAVKTQPINPAQACIVRFGSGTMPADNVMSVPVLCTTSTFTLGGTVTGLLGSGLVLSDSGNDDLAVTANGGFTFAMPLAQGVPYFVKVRSQPANPAQTCVVAGAAATMSAAPVTNIAVACANNGNIRVTVATTGLDVPSTFIAAPDQGHVTHVAANGATIFSAAPGPQNVSLLVPYNCKLADPDPVAVSVVPDSTSDVAFSVACAHASRMQVTATTTGTQAPAAYAVRAWEDFFNYHHADSVPANGTISFVIQPGEYAVTLTVPVNCSEAHGGTAQVELDPGDTSRVVFNLTCGPPAQLLVTATSGGTNVPADYTVAFDMDDEGIYALSAHVPSNGSVAAVLRPGVHRVHLIVPPNCNITSANDAFVTLTLGNTTDLAFVVSCH